MPELLAADQFRRILEPHIAQVGQHVAAQRTRIPSRQLGRWRRSQGVLNDQQIDSLLSTFGIEVDIRVSMVRHFPGE